MDYLQKVSEQDYEDLSLESTEDLDVEKIYFGYVLSDGTEPFFVSGDTDEVEISIWGNDGLGAAVFSQYEMNKNGKTDYSCDFAACPGFLIYKDSWTFEENREHLISWITEEDLEEWEDSDELTIEDIRKNVFEYIDKNMVEIHRSLSNLGIKYNSNKN